MAGLFLGVAALPPAWAAAEPDLPAETVAGVHCQWSEQDAPHWLLFAGWTVEPDWAWTWARALIDASEPAQAPGTVCVVRGPLDASFVSKSDIATRDFAALLLSRLPTGGAPVRVVAHSSGSFVAHHSFQQLRDLGGQALLRRIAYFNLDGAVGRAERELDAQLVDRLASVQAVLARDARSGDESQNAGAMRELARRYPAQVQLRLVEAQDAGCNAGARWCLHEVLINRRPYNPAGFDLARDYGGINAAHPVQWDYLR